jgi:hypothetical protein
MMKMTAAIPLGAFCLFSLVLSESARSLRPANSPQGSGQSRFHGYSRFGTVREISAAIF